MKIKKGVLYKRENCVGIQPDFWTGVDTLMSEANSFLA